jgi:hypothetical protein
MRRKQQAQASLRGLRQDVHRRVPIRRYTNREDSRVPHVERCTRPRQDGNRVLPDRSGRVVCDQYRKTKKPVEPEVPLSHICVLLIVRSKRRIADEQTGTVRESGSNEEE